MNDRQGPLVSKTFIITETEAEMLKAASRRESDKKKIRVSESEMIRRAIDTLYPLEGDSNE